MKANMLQYGWTDQAMASFIKGLPGETELWQHRRGSVALFSVVESDNQSSLDDWEFRGTVAQERARLAREG